MRSNGGNRTGETEGRGKGRGRGEGDSDTSKKWTQPIAIRHQQCLLEMLTRAHHRLQGAPLSYAATSTALQRQTREG